MPCTREQFEAAFPPIVEDLVKHAREHNMPDNALQWFETVCLLSCTYRYLSHMRAPLLFSFYLLRLTIVVP